jgi:hypothetical protein
MSVLMVTARVNADNVKDVEAAAQRMFAALHKEQPPGVRYASCKLPDGVTFVALLELEQDGGTNPLFAIPEFVEFQEGLKGWMAEPPSPSRMDVVGSYRLFGSAQQY